MSKIKNNGISREIEELAKTLTWENPTDKALQTGYLAYDVKMLTAVLSSFCKSEEGQNAKVMMLLPEGRNPMTKEFNIKEIKLLENKIVGAKEKYRLAILVM